MHMNRLIHLIAILLALSGPAAQVEWSDSNTNTIRFVTGTPSVVDTGIRVDRSQDLSRTVSPELSSTGLSARMSCPERFRPLRGSQ